MTDSEPTITAAEFLPILNMLLDAVIALDHHVTEVDAKLDAALKKNLQSGCQGACDCGRLSQQLEGRGDE